MLEVYLNRITASDEGTFGILTIPQFGFKRYSGELPNRNNERNYSRINAGRYLVKYQMSSKYGRLMPLITNTEGRSGVLLHTGNYAGDSRKGYRTHSAGCILFGSDIGYLAGQMAVLASGAAEVAFDRIIQKKDFYLTIR